MGFSYFDGKKWEDITRDERFFCQRIYELSRDGEGLNRLLLLLNAKCGLELDVESDWEFGYEVCFYRDFWHWKKKHGKCFSLKRTFDLCLFSEKTILIIEAKAQQPLKRTQVKEFREDKDALKEQLPGCEVLLIGLLSSKYVEFAYSEKPGSQTHKELVDSFQQKTLTWKDLADVFGGDKILGRADSLFDQKDLLSFGKNCTDRMLGKDLLEAAEAKKPWVMGRNRGIMALEELSPDVILDTLFEVNTETSEAPNRNWFTLSEFAAEYAKRTR